MRSPASSMTSQARRGAHWRPAFASSNCTPHTAICCTSSFRRSPTRARDAYGGSFENRTRIAREVVRAVRLVLPPEAAAYSCGFPHRTGSKAAGRSTNPFAWRASSPPLGVDVIDASSGGLAPEQRIAVGPGYQVPFAARSVVKHRSRRAPSASSPSRAKPTRSSAAAKPIWYCSRGNCCATRTGRSMQRSRWAWTRLGRRNTTEPSRAWHAPHKGSASQTARSPDSTATVGACGRKSESVAVP